MRKRETRIGKEIQAQGRREARRNDDKEEKRDLRGERRKTEDPYSE